MLWTTCYELLGLGVAYNLAMNRRPEDATPRTGLSLANTLAIIEPHNLQVSSMDLRAFNQMKGSDH
jgi:hypothetical protein